MDEPDLRALVRRAQAGERAAFEGIVKIAWRMVYAQVVGTVRDRGKAEDLTQETFVAAWKALAGCRETDKFSSWLLTVARNVVLDAVKFEGRKKRGGGASSEEMLGDRRDAERSPVETVVVNEACDQALRMLEELPEEYQRVLRMRYLGGADYETMQRALGLSDGALRGLLNRGMAMLRERMTRQER